MIVYHAIANAIDWELLRATLIADNFHNGRTTQQLRDSFVNSQVQVYAMDDDTCVGTARALSDGVGNAYVLDVWTNAEYRQQGIGRAMMNRILTTCPGQHVYLQTDDAIEFYQRLGFTERPVGMELVVGDYLSS